MWNKTLAAITVIIAVLLAIFAISLSPDQIRFVIIISRFFEVMIPVLAVGALVRYMVFCPHAKVCNTILTSCFIFVAIVLAIMAITLSPRNISMVILISRFFEVMLPVFAVGALIKYLTCSSKEKECKSQNQ